MTVSRKPDTRKKATKTRTKTSTIEPRFPDFIDNVTATLADNRTVTIRGEIGEGQLAHLQNSLNYLSFVSKEPIEIELTSLGGSVHDGLGIYDKIKHIQSKGIKVNITVFGYAMSMAVPILQAADRRRAGENATFLLHEVSYRTSGTHSANKDLIESTAKLSDRVNEIIAKRAHLTKTELEALSARRDHTFSATTALEYGLIDVII